MSELVLAYCPLQSGYSVEPASSVTEITLPGGAPRYRRGPPNEQHKVSVSWKVKSHGVAYLNAFHREWSRNPNQPFKALLSIDSGELQEYECYFVGGKAPRRTGQQGPNFQISAEFWATLLPQDIEWDRFILAMGRDDPMQAKNALERLANVTLPKHWGNL